MKNKSRSILTHPLRLFGRLFGSLFDVIGALPASVPAIVYDPFPVAPVPPRQPPAPLPKPVVQALFWFSRGGDSWGRRDGHNSCGFRGGASRWPAVRDQGASAGSAGDTGNVGDLLRADGPSGVHRRGLQVSQFSYNDVIINLSGTTDIFNVLF